MPTRIAVLSTLGAQAAFDYFRPYIVANPTGVPRWGDTEFTYNPEFGEFDGAVVWQSVAPLERVRSIVVPPTRTLLAILEPPDVLTLPDDYTRQFGGVLGPDPTVKCAHRFRRSGGHHWFVELTAAQALQQPIRTKSRLISAVVSAKSDTQGHRRRLKAIQTLKEHFGDRLDWFGRGIRELGDRKLNALEDYRYHIVFENGAWPHYWTEKLADAFVANCLPFYWGDPRISEAFDPRSCVPIDIEHTTEAVRLIEQALKENWWEQRQDALAEARRRVLEDFHPFQIWSECLAALPASEPRPVTIRPFNQFSLSLLQRMRLRWRRLRPT